MAAARPHARIRTILAACPESKPKVNLHVYALHKTADTSGISTIVVMRLTLVRCAASASEPGRGVAATNRPAKNPEEPHESHLQNPEASLAARRCRAGHHRSRRARRTARRGRSRPQQQHVQEAP